MKKTVRNGLLTLSLSTVMVVAACGNNNEDNATNDNENTNTEETNVEVNEDQENNEEAAVNENNAADNTEENDADEETNDGMNETAAPESGTSVMDQDPEEPIAIVNGEEIQSGELQGQLAQFEAMFAQQDMDEEEGAMMMMQFQQQFLDQLINQRVLAQEAESEGIEADEDEVESQMEEIRSQFDSEDDFQEALEMQGYTEEDLMQEIRELTLVEELLTMDHVDEDQYEVSEEEVREYYELASTNDPEIADQEFEDVQEDLEEQLLQNQYVEDLRESAEIEILL
ncbi:SurA N-terminal domain-containing protein [Alkalicoccus daliensis]|uniref:SurA N-terminal domain-containing protein n=1 Tax=Alkalicoccus daliensis TaxID=745820 RepID=A0A1H0AXT8_9BACI|nr:SurA N-terminal domain-containing protein [Alkalicoccus daliensis]SDN38245.1 SurA N-terminal domain-containing protein [Alkalicoccus daliensis]